MSNPAAITATYTSETNAPFTLSLPQTTPTSTGAVKAKQQSLSQLRDSVHSLQATINKELTQRMEEDNARAGTAAVDKKEEENYGEEVVEED
ncbi:hypothetical protein QC762_305225 [Podospora pseudocomata]|uniref:EKC/KEOPS complex subunit GON7 n=3 Tax=Podospora TaxID=5144 RepID=A0ABY6S6D2_PODCO|nr:hypothetical protein QC761_305225 [Podospora bellae-mahoneyi]KAK4655758.1 hypothetical protein QC762_305225 [Podospora pseudocomata]VBB77149.1 Putative protein of unknown function [Podospora comata]